MNSLNIKGRFVDWERLLCGVGVDNKKTTEIIQYQEVKVQYNIRVYL